MYDRSKLPREPLALLCRRYHVRELSLFGSALRPDYSESSDLDLLVTFEPDGIMFPCESLCWESGADGN